MEEGLKRVCKAFYRWINKKQSVFSELPNSYEDNIGSKFALQHAKANKRNSDCIIRTIKVYTEFYKTLPKSKRNEELLFIENKNVLQTEKFLHILLIGDQYMTIYNMSNKICEGSVFQLAKEQYDLLRSLTSRDKKTQRRIKRKDKTISIKDKKIKFLTNQIQDHN